LSEKSEREVLRTTDAADISGVYFLLVPALDVRSDVAEEVSGIAVVADSGFPKHHQISVDNRILNSRNILRKLKGFIPTRCYENEKQSE
jgi:hypothetical protein